MSKNFTLLNAFLNKVFRVSGSVYVLIILIAIVIVGGGRYFWKEREVEREPLPQIHLPQPLPDDTKEPADEEESEDEEDSSDQDSPWTLLKTALPSRYYEPPANTQTPSVAIILTGLGLNKSWTDHVLATLQGKVTLAFSPYSQNINDQLREATSLGYEVLIALPMEPYNYPNPDPGPLTLLAGVNPQKNIERTRTILEKTPKGTGLIREHGSRFILSQADLEPVLKEIKNHGSIFIDSNTSLHSQVQRTCKTLDMSCHQIDLTLPLSANFTQTDEFLKKVIQSAKENGIIIVSMPAIPAFIDHLIKWIGTLKENGINLVTMSNLKTLEFPPEASGDYEGGTNADKQDPH